VEGKPLKLDPLLPQQVGQTNELWVRVADKHRYLMRLLIIRVPEEGAKRRRADLEAEARRTKPTASSEGLGTSRLDDLAHRCSCSPTQFAGSSGAPARTVADGGLSPMPQKWVSH